MPIMISLSGGLDDFPIISLSESRKCDEVYPTETVDERIELASGIVVIDGSSPTLILYTGHL